MLPLGAEDHRNELECDIRRDKLKGFLGGTKF